MFAKICSPKYVREHKFDDICSTLHIQPNMSDTKIFFCGDIEFWPDRDVNGKHLLGKILDKLRSTNNLIFLFIAT
jgi:hypothetical protein